jgi:hypothetical protein
VGAATLLVIYVVVLYFLNASLLRKGVYSLSERESTIYHRNHTLKRICAIVLVVVLAVTFVWHQLATSIWGPNSIMKGTTFEDYESFVEYMEQDIPASSQKDFYDGTSSVDVPIQSEESTYYDEDGNEISEDEAMTRRIEDGDGNVVCEYIWRNKSVVSISTSKGGGILPITAYTEDDLREAQQTASVRHRIFGAAYCIECLAVVVLYFKKRAK